MGHLCGLFQETVGLPFLAFYNSSCSYFDSFWMIAATVFPALCCGCSFALAATAAAAEAVAPPTDPLPVYKHSSGKQPES